MGALASVFFVVLVSLLVTRVATVALSLTGMSTESARFQARSAYFGVGFTTTEAESVVNHPVRRRIVMWLILLGNAGVISVVATLMLSFGGGGGEKGLRLLALFAGLVVLAILFSTRAVDRALNPLIRRMLTRWTEIHVADYADLLELEGDYEVTELQVEPGDWLSGKTLGELKLRDEGVIVLGVHRGRDYIGTPNGLARVCPDDRLILYGREERLIELDRRTAADGDAAHAGAVAEQREIDAEELEIEDTIPHPPPGEPTAPSPPAAPASTSPPA
jgi:NhaP-type Na+/H+ and K+/H+ antiporter